MRRKLRPGSRYNRIVAGMFAIPLMAASALADDTRPASLALGTVLQAAEGLRPGEFLWAPQTAPSGPMLMIINLRSQRAVLYRNGLPIAITTVSTGRKGHRTPTGIFTVLQKHEKHFSSLYDAAPMPFMQRLTWDGIALHGGHLPGYPASHGCIRLPHEFARLLFAETALNMTVAVVDADTLPAIALVDAPLAAHPTDHGESFWSSDIAPSGPVSILVSTTDQIAVVLRNGREIGRVPMSFSGKLPRPALFVLQRVDHLGQHWVQLQLPGQGYQVEPLRAEQFAISSAFRARIDSVLAPGATVVVTADTIRRAGTAPELLIDSADDTREFQP